jgi:exonuclease SbcC
LERAQEALPDVRAALEGVQARRDLKLKSMAEDQDALKQTQDDIIRLDLLAKEYRNREQVVKTFMAAERNASNRVIEARQELKAMDSLRARRENLHKQRDEKRGQKAVYEELRVAFGKNGIPAMIIEDAIPELEQSANGILSRMTDGRMKLFMNTQREKVTGGVAETLDIQISDELGTRAYELYSGGEAFRINFAVRVALSQLLARRAGAHLRTLFLDEGFGTQDEDGRNKLVEAITTVQNDFDLILIITHIDELRDSFPVHIVLDKTSEGSRVSLR